MSTVQLLAIWALPLVFAITLHEAAHGWTARAFGDPTAEQQGRLTLNPIKHIDPIGTILVPVLLILLPAGFVFGWAKPVPVNVSLLGSPKRDMALVAVAGPLSNLIMAAGWALIAKLGVGLLGGNEWIALPLVYMGQAGIAINLVLLVLNLLPLPPLDGSRVLAGLLPDRFANWLGRVEPYGLIILIALLVFGLLGEIIGPPYVALTDMFHHLFVLPF